LESTPRLEYVTPLYTYAGTLKLMISSSPIAIGAMPNASSGMYPASEPASTAGTPGEPPASDTLGLRTVLLLTMKALVAPATRRLLLTVVSSVTVVSLNEVFCAVTSQVLTPVIGMRAGEQLLARLTDA
jgi:hypothetical protein